jgi:nitroreductase
LHQEETMNFFDVIEKRRSIRKFTDKAVPKEVMQKAFESAVLAPNSSNTQTWNFYWVTSADKKEKLIDYCLGQSAARTAQELVVITADPNLWKRSQGPLADYVQKVNAPKHVIDYYKKLIPFVYRYGYFNSLAPIKWLMANGVGLFRPMMRGPFSKRDIQEVAIKSAALAAENFVLSITAQGFATCMMEGFDECRVSQLLKLKCSERAVMVIGIGEEAERGTWGPRFRLPLEQVVHKV